MRDLDLGMGGTFDRYTMLSINAPSSPTPDMVQPLAAAHKMYHAAEAHGLDLYPPTNPSPLHSLFLHCCTHKTGLWGLWRIALGENADLGLGGNEAIGKCFSALAPPRSVATTPFLKLEL